MLPGRTRIICIIYIAHVAWVGSVLFNVCRSCSTSHNGRWGLDFVDHDLSDLSDLSMCEMLGLIKYDPYRSTPVSLCTSVCLSVCIVPSAAVGAEAAIPLLAYRRARKA